MKLSRLSFSLCLAALFSALLVHSGGAAQFSIEQTPPERVVNGGFESGNFSPWIVNDPSGFTNVGGDPAFAHSGNFHANLGASGLLGTLTQSLSTVPGQSYNLSFWLANDSGVQPTAFMVFWNGAQIFSLPNSAAFSYTLFSFGNLTATGSSTSLQFQFRHDADFFRLDDVSVVPEPSTNALLLGAGTVLAFMAYRGRRLAA